MSRARHRRWRGRTWLRREGLGPGHPRKEVQPTQTQQLLPNAGQESKSKSKFNSLWIPSHLSIPAVQVARSQGPFPTHLWTRTSRRPTLFDSLQRKPGVFKGNQHSMPLLLHLGLQEHFNLFFHSSVLHTATDNVRIQLS